MTTNRLFINAAANWAGTIAQMGAAFVVSPIIVRGLGDQRYGVWALVESILAYLTLFDLGIGAAVVRYVAKFESGDDPVSLNRTFSASICLFAAAGAAVLLVAAVMLGPAWSLLPVPHTFAYEAWWQLAILSFNLAIGLPLGVFASVLDGLQRYVAKAAIRTIGLIIRSGLLVAVVTNGGGLFLVAVTVTAVAVIEYLIMAVVAFLYHPHLRFSPILVDRASITMIGGYSLDAFVAMIAGRISLQTDALVIGAFLPLSQITYFALSARLCEHAKNALRSMTSVLTPHVSQLEGQNRSDDIRVLHTTATRWAVWVTIPVQLGLWLLGKPFFRLWMGSDYAERCYPVLFILAAPLALTLSQSVSARIHYGTGNLRHFSRLSLAGAITNLSISLLLVRPYGTLGVAIGTSLPALIVSLILARSTCSLLNYSLMSYVRNAFMVPAFTAAIVLAPTWLATDRYFGANDWLHFIVVATTGLALFWGIAVCCELGWSRTIAFLSDRLLSIGLHALDASPTQTHD